MHFLRIRPMPPSEPTRLPAPSLSRWFAEEVQPHEPALRAYLQARFPTLGDHDDLVQETYTRLLRAQGNGGVRYPKAFLFTAARNAALDLFRRRGAKATEAAPRPLRLLAPRRTRGSTANSSSPAPRSPPPSNTEPT
jgi:DNA-directed RNA polymerase specialized sigma24 family protein